MWLTTHRDWIRMTAHWLNEKSIAVALWNLKMSQNFWIYLITIQVNGGNMSEMIHSEAIAFLRCCPDSVTIRLFRDSAVTPLSPFSPMEPESGLNRPRPLLRCVVSKLVFESWYTICVNFFYRQEAQDLLHDLAVRKQGGSRGASPAPALSGSPCSPRRRRLTKTPSPDLATVVKDRKLRNYLVYIGV